MRPERIACALVGVPGVVEPARRPVSPRRERPRTRGRSRGARGSNGRSASRSEVFNDVNLAAIGERDEGVGRGVRDFVFVSVGTGLGAGIVLGGELSPGSHGAAGELDLLRPVARL